MLSSLLCLVTSTIKTYGVWSPKWWFAILKLLWQDGQLDSWLCTPRNVDWLDVMKLHLWLNTCMYIRWKLVVYILGKSWASVGGCWNSVNEKGVDWSWSREVFSMQSFYNLGWRKDYWRMCVTNILQLTSHTKLLDWWACECWHALWYGKSSVRTHLIGWECSYNKWMRSRFEMTVARRHFVVT